MKRDAIDFERDRVSSLFRKLLIPSLLGTEGIWLAMPAAEFTTLAIILASSRKRRCQK